ncbi:MAG: sulfatase-like hydrolase/transferase, partial [Acidobacteria bacterium]|nr:sulfatase-like hydrolase/transferase [Acidobacteriota bacterium]
GMLARQPGQEEVAIEYVKLLGRMGRHEDVLRVLAPFDREEPRILNLRGYSELLAGRREQARQLLERSIAAARAAGQDYAPALYHLGLYYRWQGEPERAIDLFRRACGASPSHLAAHYQWMATAEQLGLADDLAIAKGAFGRIYRAQLARSGAMKEPKDPGPAVDRSVKIEDRPVAEGVAFRRRVPAGASLEIACRTPSSASARFVVRIERGPGEGTTLLDVVHEGGPGGARWIPHDVTLPPGAAGAEAELLFEIRSTGWLADWRRSAPPAGAAFSEPQRTGSGSPRSADPRPNVLLISLDTLRGDRVGHLGSGRATSPALDRLAQEGVSFTRAEAPSSWTLPSHFSIFSGLTPAAHGVLPDLEATRGFMWADRVVEVRSSGRERMLTEAFKEAGYRTVAVTENGWLAGRFGFGQGFDVYRSDMLGNYWRTAAAAFAELEAHGEAGPWFLFVHTYTPHQPYHAPREFRLRWADPESGGLAWPTALVPMEEYLRFRAPVFLPAPTDVAAFRDLYDGQVVWSDTLVERLVGWLDRRGLAEQTIVVVLSDHGEEIFERGEFDHINSLHEEVSRVPLVMRAPGRLPPGRSVGSTVSLIDVPATLLDLAGLGDRLGQGTTLRPAWERDLARPAFAQTIGTGSQPIAAVWDGVLKYLRRETKDGVVERLFDLARDPGEIRDQSTSRPAELARLRALHEAHARESATIRQDLGTTTEELDPETLERLKSLGYAR